MTRKILLLAASVAILSACSTSCSDQFVDANDHIMDTAQSVYEVRSEGKITADAASGYQEKIENAYVLTNEGSTLCDSDEDAAEDKFEEAEEILDTVDDALENTEEKGE